MVRVPTEGDEFAKMIEFLRKAQECAAMLAHLANANDRRKRAIGWLAVEQQLKLTVTAVTTLATKSLQ